TLGGEFLIDRATDPLPGLNPHFRSSSTSNRIFNIDLSSLDLLLDVIQIQRLGRANPEIVASPASFIFSLCLIDDHSFFRCSLDDLIVKSSISCCNENQFSKAQVFRGS